jgi:hypothetical protein
VAIVLVGILAIGGSLAALSLQGPSTTPGPSLVAVASTIPPAGSPTPTPVSTAFPTAAETKLLATLPADLRATCLRGHDQVDLATAGFNLFEGTMPGPAEASLTCRPASRPISASFLWYALGAGGGGDPESRAQLAVVAIEKHFDVPSGDCAKPPAGGSWRSLVGGSGTVMCLKDTGPNGQPWIYWTLGSAHVLGVATAPVGQYQALYAWWQAVTQFLN